VRCKDLADRGAAAKPPTSSPGHARDERAAGSGRQRPEDEGGSGRGREGAGSGQERGERERGQRERSGRERSAEGRPSKRAHTEGGRGSPDGRAASRSAPSWLHANIRVRIVDKHTGGGKLYLKKGTVVDVHPGGKCDVSVDETRQVLLLPQSSLETVVPKEAGAALLIVAGQHRGQRAKLLQCNVSSGAAAVQLAGDLSVQRVLLDDVAAFVGTMDVDEDHY
jgi:G patch domain/KOW motif-containing protein